MNILYAVQATGNGHLSRAREIVPHLMNYGNVDLLVSGRQAEVNLPFLIKFKKKGLSYTFGKRGGIDYVDSIKQLRPLNLIKDIYSFPVTDYRIVINDFEPVSAWACKLKGKPCVAMSHQAAYLSNKTPRPENQEVFAEWILRNYAPSTSHYGFHFKSFDKHIYTPVIRREIRHLELENKNHITVYLPAHADELLIKTFAPFKDIKWQIFSKHTKTTYRNNHIFVSPVDNDSFIQSMASSDGVITAGGFESVAEAIHLRKKVMVLPMTNQYEQQCNAVAAKSIGVTVVKSLPEMGKRIQNWLTYEFPPNLYYPDNTAKIVAEIIESGIH